MIMDFLLVEFRSCQEVDYESTFCREGELQMMQATCQLEMLVLLEMLATSSHSQGSELLIQEWRIVALY